MNELLSYLKIIKKNCSLKIKVSEVLLCFKDKAYVKKLSDIYSLRNVKFYDYESYNIYEKKFIKKSFLICQDGSNLRRSYQLSDLSQNDYFAMRIYIYIYIYVCI